jgi:hypothetical protein
MRKIVVDGVRRCDAKDEGAREVDGGVSPSKFRKVLAFVVRESLLSFELEV